MPLTIAEAPRLLTKGRSPAAAGEHDERGRRAEYAGSPRWHDPEPCGRRAAASYTAQKSAGRHDGLLSRTDVEDDRGAEPPVALNDLARETKQRSSDSGNDDQCDPLYR